MPRATTESTGRRILKGAALFFACAALIAACSRADNGCAIQSAGLPPLQVQSVVDGDTLRLAGGDKVRLIGINTPERGRDGARDEPLAREAAAALAELLGRGDRVLLREGADPLDDHQRRLAHAFDLSGRNLAAELLRRGLGFHVAIAPNFAYLECLQRAEGEAARAGRGVWGVPEYRARAVAELEPGQGGFIRLRDRVTRVSFKENGWWLQLGGRVGVRIRGEGQRLFERASLRELEGRTVEVRGWLVAMRGDWWMMSLGHPAMLRESPSGP